MKLFAVYPPEMSPQVDLAPYKLALVLKTRQLGDSFIESQHKRTFLQQRLKSEKTQDGTVPDTPRPGCASVARIRVCVSSSR